MSDPKPTEATEIKPCPFCGGFVKLELRIRDDEHKYPRPHWHARIQCCSGDTGWNVVSEQLGDCYSEQDREKQRNEINDTLIKSWVINPWNTRAEDQTAQVQYLQKENARLLEVLENLYTQVGCLDKELGGDLMDEAFDVAGAILARTKKEPI